MNTLCFSYIYRKNTIFAQFNKRKNIPYNEYSEKCLFSIYRNIHAATLLFVLTLLPNFIVLLFMCLYEIFSTKICHYFPLKFSTKICHYFPYIFHYSIFLLLFYIFLLFLLFLLILIF